MKQGQTKWTRKELILAINQYCKMPFGKIHQGNPDVIHLAELFGRSPGAVSWKLVNFASLDPSLQERGIAGAKNASKLDEQIWNEFYHSWDELAFESEKVKAEFENTSLEKLHEADEQTRPKEGLEKEQTVKARVNQNFFRQMIMANYDYRCCITGLKQPELLVAGHIKPWSQDKQNRVNPQNGLAINALHDKAFEEGLITITPENRIKISSALKNKKDQKGIELYFLQYEEQEIFLPNRFLPEEGFLRWHYDQVFTKSTL